MATLGWLASFASSCYTISLQVQTSTSVTVPNLLLTICQIGPHYLGSHHQYQYLQYSGYRFLLTAQGSQFDCICSWCFCGVTLLYMFCNTRNTSAHDGWSWDEHASRWHCHHQYITSSQIKCELTVYFRCCCQVLTILMVIDILRTRPLHLRAMWFASP